MVTTAAVTATASIATTAVAAPDITRAGGWGEDDGNKLKRVGGYEIFFVVGPRPVCGADQKDVGNPCYARGSKSPLDSRR
jgi:hypothetical protein